MRDSHIPPPTDEEAEAIRAELEALGEDVSDALDEELAQGRALDTALDLASRPMDASLHDALWHSPQAPPAPPQQADLGLLHAQAPSAALDPLRSERLLRGLHTRLNARSAQPELDLIHDQLLDLDIPIAPGDRLTHDQRNGAHLNAVLDAVRSDAPMRALDALPEPTETLRDGAYADLHLLRASSAHARLDADRAATLGQAVQDQHAPKAKVIPLRARWFARPALLSAAAALLVALVVALIWSDALVSPDHTPDPNTHAAPVAQVELLDAQRRYRTEHAAALERLTAQNAAPSRPGDHALRDLRHAQHTMLRARSQAKRRRL